MKRLRILSWLIEFARVRPLVVVALLVICVDLIYVNLLFRSPNLKSGDATAVTSAENVTIKGKIREKNFDETGKVKSVVVGNVLCYVNCETVDQGRFKLGATVAVGGDIKEIEGPMNPGEFNRKNYYGTKGVFFEMSAETIATVSAPKLGIREWFLNLRLRVSERIMRFFTLEGGTVNTLLCGDKTFLSKERKDLYTNAGVGHFLVISGLHISAVGTCIYRAFRRAGVKVRHGCVAAMGFLLLYGIFVGFSISVIRAVVMFFIRLLADVLKRIYDMLNAVAVAAVVNVAINPLCVTDTAFIYSYVTVLAIAVYVTFISPGKAVEKGLRGVVKRYLKFPLVLWLFVMPVNLCLSYGCSVASVLINALLAPLSAPILILAFLGLGLSYTGLPVPVGVADFLIALILRGFDKLCKLTSLYPMFTLLGRPALWKVCVYYVLLLWILFKGKNIVGTAVRVGVALGAVLFIAAPVNLSGQVTTLYVGQGECVVVHTGAGSAVIYDCGSTSKSNIGEYTVIPYLRYTGVSRVDAIFVSHGDYDHVGEVAYLIKNLAGEGVRLRSLVTQDIAKAGKSKFLAEAEATARSEGVPVLHMSKGQRMRLGDFSFTCMWPAKGYSCEDVNESSMVILASKGDFDALLCGDATSETERHIIKSVAGAMSGNLEFLSVSHHGSNSASDAGFLKAMTPRTAVVSAGINNRYGHPHKEVLKRFRQYTPKTVLLRTDKSGAVSVAPRGRGIRISVFRR